MKRIVLIIFLLNSITFFAQGEANFWFFGRNAGIDFNNGTTTPISGNLYTYEGCASFSSQTGNLLFYTDGITVWDKNHGVMPNGQNLLGDPSSTQSAIIVPHPGNADLYFIFTVDANDYDNDGNVIKATEGLHCYTVDMTANGGFGDIVGAPVPLSGTQSDQWTEKVTSVKGSECNTFWIISLVNNKFVSFKVDSSGLNPTPVESLVNFQANDARGYLKVSPNGTKIASATYGLGNVTLYSFDDTTGLVSNDGISLIQDPDIDGYTYGVEFSPNSTKLYCTTYKYNSGTRTNRLFQFDLNNADVVASKTLINSQYGFRGALQLAPNGKIYITVPQNYSNGTNYLNAINFPDELGANCNFELNALYLGTGIAMQGLPPFIASLLMPVEITDSNTNKNLNNTIAKRCIGENYLLTAQNIEGTPTYKWTFNNVVVSTTASLNFPSLSLADEGVYTFEAETIDNCGFTIKYEGKVEIEVYEPPTITKPSNILQCDDDNDGFFSFDLNSLRDAEVLNGQDSTVFEVLYFNNQTDADADDNVNSISNPYTNITAFGTETLYARIQNIQNPICYETETFTLQVFESPKPATSIVDLQTCDSNLTGSDTDGIETFDLTSKETEILNGQDAASFTITYFEDAANTIQILNPSTYQNTTANLQTIYVKVENSLNSNCAATTSFVLEVFQIPTILKPSDILQCDDDNDGFFSFDLNSLKDTEILNGQDPTVFEVQYFNNQADADNNVNSISNPYTNLTAFGAEILFVRIQNIRNTSCYKTESFTLQVFESPKPATSIVDLQTCDSNLTGSDTDGIETFDLTSKEGEILNGQDAASFTITYFEDAANTIQILNPSTYQNTTANLQTIYVKVENSLNSNCAATTSFVIEIFELPVINNFFVFKQCDEDGVTDGFTDFNLTEADEYLTFGDTTLNVSYYLTANDADSASSSINPSPFSNRTQQTVYARIENLNNCHRVAQVDLLVSATHFPPDFLQTVSNCDDDADIDGLSYFNLADNDADIINALPPGQNLRVSYYRNLADAQLESNEIPKNIPYLSEVAYSQFIYVRVESDDNGECFGMGPNLNLIVNPRPEFELDATDIYCLNLPPITVSVYNAKGVYNYKWYDENGVEVGDQPYVLISAKGDYTVIATSSFGCESFPKTIHIETSIIANITQDDITVVDDSANNSITIATGNLGIGDYEFALDDSFSSFQDEPYFDNVSAGIHTVYIRDKNQCGVAQIDVSVLGFPKFFTPNNDGFNDTWTISGVDENFYYSSKIYVFDRFGKLITQIDPKSNGWDGLFNGEQLPATDYWFKAELIDENGNIRIRKGHFSLKR